MIEKTASKHIWFRIYSAFSILALSVAVTVAVGFSVVGTLTGEPWRANFAFALLIISLLTALAVVLSYGASAKVMQVARTAWFIVAVVCLVFAQYILRLPASDAHKAADTVLLLTMLILAFPAGIIAIGFAFVYSSFILPDSGVRPADMLIIWSVFVVAGYLQWFKLLPYLIKKWRSRRSRSSPA